MQQFVTKQFTALHYRIKCVSGELYDDDKRVTWDDAVRDTEDIKKRRMAKAESVVAVYPDEVLDTVNTVIAHTIKRIQQQSDTFVITMNQNFVVVLAHAIEAIFVIVEYPDDPITQESVHEGNT